jgi:hypothetical protein
MKKGKQKVKIMLSTIRQITQEKNTFQRVGNSRKEGQAHSLREKGREQMLPVWEVSTFQSRMSRGKEDNSPYGL